MPKGPVRQTILALMAVAVSAGQVFGGDQAIEVKTFKTHSRLAFRIDEGVDVEKKNVKGGFEILLKGAGLADFGVPLGEEDLWKAKFRGLGDPRLDSIQFTEVPGGLRVSGKWVFPTGPKAPADAQMEWFDYREKTPPLYVVDFWVKKGPTVAEVQAARRQAERLDELGKAEAAARERKERKLASAKRESESSDVTSFCQKPLSGSSDVFLPLLPAHEKVDFSRWFSTTTPDSQFVYYEPKTKTRDAQYVRLALDLYRKGKPALVLRTLDLFEVEHPDSDFRHQMKFLRANAMIKLGLHQEAESILERLKISGKASPEALYSGMYLVGKRLREGSALAALENALWLMKHFAEHRLNWVFHLGAAESLYALKQTERAAKEYEWIVEHAQDPSAKAEAAFRIGDLYLDRFRHDQALAAYSRALSHFGEEARTFPSIHVNRAEALYGIEDYSRAKEAFNDFLEKFPAHPSGWRATMRLGEILGRDGAEDSRKWFYETINRYPFSPGATLSRLRLIPCGDHGGFNYESAERFFSDEATKFDGRGEVSLGLYREFRGLAHVRSLIAFGKQDSAVTVAISEMQATGRQEAREIFGQILSTLYQNRILALLNEGKKYEALAFYNEKSGLIPRVSTRDEPDYLLRLSHAASDLRLGKLALGLLTTYKQVVDRGAFGRTVAGVDLGVERKLEESEIRFAEAKALWVDVGLAEEGKIREHLGAVVEESPFSFEREIILALLDDRAGKTKAALAHALKAQILRPTKVGSAVATDWQIEAWVADLQARAGDLGVALEMYRNVERILKLAGGKEPKDSASVAVVLGVPLAPSLDGVLIAQAELLERLGRWGDVAANYSRAMEEGLGGSRSAYGYARALLKAGDPASRAKAISTLQKLINDKADPGAGPDFWKKLAAETLSGEQSRPRATTLRNVAGESDLTKAKEGKK
jgi:tetratricopeptide (TPR) repeat protein